MTKPIEWTTTENMPVIFWHRMHVDESGELRDATPSDLVAALAAMGEGEREEVLRASGAAASFDMQTAIIADLRARLRSTDAAWVESEKRFEAATARADTAAASHLASAGLVAEFRGRLAAAESALDVAQSRAVRAEKLADEALADRDRARASLDIVRHDLRGTRAEVDALRSRLIAAETTAAQREPREYPLAPNSEWSGDAIVDGRGTIQEYEGGYVTVRAHVGSAEARITLIAANLAALLHRAGVV